MTPAQCRAARAILDLTQPGLAEAAGLSLSTLVDFEKGRRPVPAPTRDRIRHALEEKGAIFLAENGDGPGVRLRKTTTADLIKPKGPETNAVRATDEAIEKYEVDPPTAKPRQTRHDPEVAIAVREQATQFVSDAPAARTAPGAGRRKIGARSPKKP